MTSASTCCSNTSGKLTIHPVVSTHSTLLYSVQSPATSHLVSKAGTAGTAHLCHVCCACERALTPAHESHGRHTAHLLQVHRSHASQLGPHWGWPRLLLIHQHLRFATTRVCFCGVSHVSCAYRDMFFAHNLKVTVLQVESNLQ